MQSKKKILAAGEIIWDIYPDKKTIGGAPLNFAAHAALCGAQSALLSAVGRDKLGEKACEALKEFGVDTRFVGLSDRPTGSCLVELDKNGVPQYTIVPDTAYDNIRLSEEIKTAIREEAFDALYFGTLIQRNEISRKAVREIAGMGCFPEIFCDVNLRRDCYDRDSVEFCLKTATVLKVSMEEEPLLRAMEGYEPKSESLAEIAGAVCRRFGQIKTVILTLGKDGSFAYSASEGKEYRESAFGDKVISTVGAGDSFSAAWLTEYLCGKPIEVCMQKAARLSGFVVAHTDAVPKYKLSEI